VTPAAKRGEQLFFSQPLSCFRCHGGFNFSSGTDFEGRRGGEGEGRDSKYKVPTLRNVAVTAPYMHDGSLATLSDVLDEYAAGRRLLDEGAHGFPINVDQKLDLIAFLNTLTDTEFLHDPRFSDPRRH
jgi:cytochrome c peroxidase